MAERRRKWLNRIRHRQSPHQPPFPWRRSKSQWRRRAEINDLASLVSIPVLSTFLSFRPPPSPHHVRFCSLHDNLRLTDIWSCAYCRSSDGGSSSSIDNATSASTDTFVTALVFNLAVFGIELGVFTLVRPYFPAIYQPRTYIVPEK